MQLQHQKITLDVNDTRAFTVLNAHQGDSKTRFIDITLTENGNTITLSSSYVATVKASINNKTKAVNTAVVNSTNNVITVELTKTMLDTPGLLNCEVILQDNQQFVTSATFTVKVAESVISDESAIVASQEFGKLIDALIEIKDIEDKADRVQTLVDNIDKLESANDIVTRLSNVESKETQLETQHKTDVQALTDKANSIVDQANTDRQNFNNSVDEINTTLDTKENVSNKVSEITHPSLDYYPNTKAVFDYVNSKLETPLSDIESLKSGKLDKTDFNTYKTATDKAVKDNADNIKLLDTNKANLVQSKNLFDLKSYLDMLSNNQLPVVNGVLNNVDKSNNSFTFTTTGHDCYTNFWRGETSFKVPVEKNTTYTMSWDFSGSDGLAFVFFNGVTGSGNMVQTKNSNKKLTFTTKEDTTFVTVRFGINDNGTSATIGNIQIELGEVATDYMPCRVATGVKELDNKVDKLQDFNKTKFTAIADEIINNSIKNTTDKTSNIVITDSSNYNIVSLVADNDNYNLSLYGKNLLNFKDFVKTLRTNAFVAQGSTTVVNNTISYDMLQGNYCGIYFKYNEFIKDSLLIDKSCVISLTVTVDKSCTFRLLDESSNKSVSKVLEPSTETQISLPITLNQSTRAITFYGVNITETTHIKLSNIMIELGSVATGYEDYKDMQSISKDTDLSKVHTYYPNTTIIADCDCQVEYIADTKNYIDNKFNELATALVAHESEVN